MTRWQQFPCFTMMCVYLNRGLIHRNRQLFAFRIHLLEEKSDRRHRVAMKVNKEKFFEHLFEVF